MKSIIVYYSLEGNCKLIAESMAKEIGADTLELKLKKAVPTSAPMKFVIGGRSAMMKETPELSNSAFNIFDYDLVIVGSPVWAGTYAPAIRTFAADAKVQNKKMAFFACSGGGSTAKCINNMKDTFKSNTYLSEISFVNPLSKDTKGCVNNAIAWAKGLS